MIWKKQPVGSKLADLQNNKAGKDTATQSAAGLMSAADKTKLDGVATGATAVSVVNGLNSDSTTSALSAAQGKALNSKSSSALAAGITLFKYGSMRIINCTNGSGSISTDGLDIGETAVAAPSSAYCMYYDGSSNKEGILRVDGTKVYVRNTSGTNVSASYIQGQIVYYV